MKVIDISMTIYPEMDIYPGDITPNISWISRIEEGSNYNLSKLTLGSHTGTHVDATLHFLSNGTGIDKLPLQKIIGPAQVRDLSRLGRPIISRDLDSLEKAEIILLKGSKANLTPEVARFIVDNNIKTIGTESLSIAAKGMENEVHRILLKSDIVIIEGLDLSHADDGDYFLVCLPLKIAGCDGAPARAVLISDL